MNEFIKTNNIVIICDLHGIISGVINTGVKLRERKIKGKTLTSIIDKRSLQKSLNFLEMLNQNNTAFNFDMTLDTIEGAKVFNFSGIKIPKQILIIATDAAQELNELFEEMGQIISEQTNIIRACNEEKAKIAKIERQRIEKDLHDTVSQTIFSTRLIAEVLPELWQKNRDEALKQIEKIKILTGESLIEMRRVLLELKPDAFSAEEVNELLKQLVNSVKIRSGIDARLRIYGEGKLDKELKEVIYRVAQESLNNAIRHSGASAVKIVFKYLPESVFLEVSDNGKGFDPGKVASNKYGLYIMQERANSLNGELKIKSVLQKGTKIMFRCRI